MKYLLVLLVVGIGLWMLLRPRTGAGGGDAHQRRTTAKIQHPFTAHGLWVQVNPLRQCPAPGPGKGPVRQLLPEVGDLRGIQLQVGILQVQQVQGQPAFGQVLRLQAGAGQF